MGECVPADTLSRFTSEKEKVRENRQDSGSREFFLYRK